MLLFCHLKLARVFVGNQTNDNHLCSAFKVKVPLCLQGRRNIWKDVGWSSPPSLDRILFFPILQSRRSFSNHVPTKVFDLPTTLTWILRNTSFSLIWYLKNEHLLPTILSLLSYPVLVFTKFLDGLLWPICRAGFSKCNN